MTPTQRTLKLYRSLGYTCTVVERWNQFAGRRQDLWGGDILAMNDQEVLLVQACAGASHAARETKARGNPNVAAWLSGPFRGFHVCSWAKRGPRGKRKTWVHRTTLVLP